jgi:uncharacterized protein
MYFKWGRSMKWGALALPSFLLVTAAHAASFDCAKASTKIELVICDNPEISKLDDELNTAYKEALQNQEQADAIMQAQRQWVKERNRCLDVNCVKNIYEHRIASLPASHAPMAQTSAAGSAVSAAPLSKTSKAYAYWRLISGNGVDVCEAYEKNLNSLPPNPYKRINQDFKGFARPVWRDLYSS